MPNFPNGKVSIRFQDQNNDDFTETPFYTNANFMTDNPLPNISHATAMSRFQQAISDMCNLTTGTHISTKINYEVEII